MTTLIDPPHHEARAPTRGMQTNNHIGPTPYGRGSGPPPDDIRQVTEQEALEALEEAGWRA